MHFEAKNILDSPISSFLLFIDPGTARLFDEIREKFTLRNNFSAILAYLAYGVDLLPSQPAVVQ